jgi:hypothetical protein
MFWIAGRHQWHGRIVFKVSKNPVSVISSILWRLVQVIRVPVLAIILQDLLSVPKVISKVHVPWSIFGLDGRLGGTKFG